MKVKTTLNDLQGEPHNYTCEPFAFDECFDLGLELAAVVGGPLGEAFKGLLIGSEDLSNLDEQGFIVAAGLVGELPGRLISRGGSKLIARILATTQRVGEDDKGEIRQYLKDADDRTAAYAGGNLREAIDAVRWILTVNYGPFLTVLWDALQPQLAALALSRGIGPEEIEPSELSTTEPEPTAIES